MRQESLQIASTSPRKLTGSVDGSRVNPSPKTDIGGLLRNIRGMPSCTVRRYVRLIPKKRGAPALSAIAIFTEERAPDERGEPGPLISRMLNDFSGPAGSSLRELLAEGDAWDIDVRQRLDPLEWDP